MKQLTSTLMYPEDPLGQEFWRRVYEKAQEQFGTTEIPVNTFNKIWIVPDKALIYENGDTTFVLENHLKVMLEEDYVSMQKSLGTQKYGLDARDQADTGIISQTSSDIIRQVLIPEIEREVNEGKNFANLRQIYNSMLLATWYKRAVAGGLLGKVYVDQKKIKGVDVSDKNISEKIYHQYVQAFENGVYNKIQEVYDPATDSMIPRKYFLGGMKGYSPEFVGMGQIQKAGSGVKLLQDNQGRGTYAVSVDLLEYSSKNSDLYSASPIAEVSSPLTGFDGFVFGRWSEKKSIEQAVVIFDEMENFLQENSESSDKSIPLGIFVNQRLRSLILFLMQEVLKRDYSPDEQKAQIHKMLQERLFDDSDFTSSVRSVMESSDIYEDEFYREDDKVFSNKVEEFFQDIFGRWSAAGRENFSKVFETLGAFDKRLFALVQWDLRNRFPGAETLKLLRGSWDYLEVEETPGQKGKVDLPGETYFTDDPSTAEAFGTIFEAEVPFDRILSVWWISARIIGEDVEPEFTVSDGPMGMSLFYIPHGINTSAQKEQYESWLKTFRNKFHQFERLRFQLHAPTTLLAESSSEQAIRAPKNLIFENDFEEWLGQNIVEPLEYGVTVSNQSWQDLQDTINFWLDPNAERDLAAMPGNGKNVRNKKMAGILQRVISSLSAYPEISRQLGDYHQRLSAASSAVGGINFNPAMLDLQIRRNPAGVPLKMEFQPFEKMNIEGFIPVIINVVPVSLPSLLGINNMPSS